jgi:iron transport multicopper oxidase
MVCITLPLALLVLVTPVLAGVQELWWNLTYVENVNPDGLFERRAIGVNGTWPWGYFPMYF